MTLHDLEQIQKAGQDYTEQPSRRTWDRLDQKLRNRRGRKKLRQYRNLSFAAIFIAVLSCVSILSFYLTHRHPDVFVSNEDYVPILLEELEPTDDGIYSLANINELNQVYENNTQLLFGKGYY